MTPEQAFRAALKMAGGATEAAERLGVTRSYLYRLKTCPTNLVLKLAGLTGNRITVHELCPELYYSSREEFLANT